MTSQNLKHVQRNSNVSLAQIIEMLKRQTNQTVDLSLIGLDQKHSTSITDRAVSRYTTCSHPTRKTHGMVVASSSSVWSGDGINAGEHDPSTPWLRDWRWESDYPSTPRLGRWRWSETLPQRPSDSRTSSQAGPRALRRRLEAGFPTQHCLER